MKNKDNVCGEGKELQKSDLSELVLNPLSDLMIRQAEVCAKHGKLIYEKLVQVGGLVEAIGNHLKDEFDRREE